MKKSTLLKFIVAGFIFLAVYLFWDELRMLDIQGFVMEAENRFYGSLAIIALFASKSIFFFLPAPLFYISAGMLLSTPLAFLLICGGLFLEFSLTYSYGFILGRDFVEKLLSRSRQFRKILDYNLENDLKMAFTLRLIPINLEAVSLFMGASGNRFWRFIAASIMGLIPKILVFVLIGNSIVHPVTTSTITLFLLMMAAWAVAITILNRNYILEEHPSGQQD